MFEGFKRRFIAQPGDSPLEKKIKSSHVNEVVKSAALGATTLGAAFGGAVAGVDEYAKEHHTPTFEQVLQHEAQLAQEKGPGGISVAAHPETGTATINVPAGVILPKPRPEQPVLVDLSHPKTSVELHEKATDVDETHPIAEMKAPE